MTALLELRDAHKSYGRQILLDGAGATFHDDRKVGLIGRNGAGKSTLARILLGEEELDAGELYRHPGLRLGYLRQHDPFLPGETVMQFLRRDSERPEWRCGEVAGKFELKGACLTEPVTKLSGGWQSRVKLAALLLHEPNLLLLDEPTNFLDLGTLMLLERFLQSFAGGCLVISHDRAFLGAVCGQTLDLARGRLIAYPGPVAEYLAEKRQRQEQDERTNQNLAAKRRQLQTFIDKNRAGANTASQAKNKQKQLDRLELIEIEGPEARARLRLPPVMARPGLALRCSGLAVGYPERTVAAGIELDIDHGQRVAVVGDNGQGKTTFLRTLAGSLAACGGTWRWGVGCEMGVYAQHVYSALPPQLTVREYLGTCAASDTPTQTVLDVAGSFLFSGEAVDKPTRVLSGGERARLCLAGLFLAGHNVLILDEPANHLDVETSAELAGALAGFAGTVIFTSHDRTFMASVATQVVEVRDGRIRLYPGDYPRYVEDLRGRLELSDRPTAAPKPVAENDDAKRRGRERYRLDKEIAALERQIAKQQEPLRALEEKMLACAADWQALAKLHAEKQTLAAQISELEEQWLALNAERDGL